MSDEPKSVLVVDDDDGIREALYDILSDEGYLVYCAANGLEALESARAHRPSVILLDLMMPLCDGWEFRTRQRQDLSMASIPVIVMSAIAGLSRLPLDVDAVLPKPIKYPALLHYLQRFSQK